jgi:hypothetical protein
MRRDGFPELGTGVHPHPQQDKLQKQNERARAVAARRQPHRLPLLHASTWKNTARTFLTGFRASAEAFANDAVQSGKLWRTRAFKQRTTAEGALLHGEVLMDPDAALEPGTLSSRVSCCRHHRAPVVSQRKSNRTTDRAAWRQARVPDQRTHERSSETGGYSDWDGCVWLRCQRHRFLQEEARRHQHRKHSAYGARMGMRDRHLCTCTVGEQCTVDACHRQPCSPGLHLTMVLSAAAHAFRLRTPRMSQCRDACCRCWLPPASSCRDTSNR